MWRRSRCLVWVVLVGVMATGTASAATETKGFVAFSMRVVEERVKAAMGAGTDFGHKEPDLFYSGGITKPWGLVVDSASADWILFGERDPKGSVLTLDDWVTALRARIVQSKHPGVTVDSRSDPNAQVQDVRFFGGVENTHVGQVRFDADWLVKRIGLGLERVQVAGLVAYYDLSVAEARAGGGWRA